MIPDNINVLTLSAENKEHFTDMLQQALIFKFGDDIPENYSYSKPWGLLSLIKNDELDTYQLLYMYDKIWTGSGGIVRDYEGKKIYQAMFRGFSCAGASNAGLGIKTPTFVYCLEHQINRARINKCESVILSFNIHNERLYKVTRDYTLPKTFSLETWDSNSEPVMFNGVLQWLLTMKL